MGLPIKRGFFIFLITLFLAALSSCHVVRYIFWNFADISDNTKFPADTLHTGQYSNRFVKRVNPVNISIPEGYKQPGTDSSFEDFLSLKQTVAFLIIRNDTILYQKYFENYDSTSVLPGFSIAKSFVSALTGIAIGEGYIKSIHQPVTDFLPELKKNGFDKVTLEDLLTMRSGIRFKEGYTDPFSGMAKFYYGLNLRRYVRKLKVTSEPGKQYNYQSANSQILAMVIEKATGQRISDYLEEKIWKPAGMNSPGTWNVDSRKHRQVKAFCCINATALDFANFGQLYLNKGAVDGHQVIPYDWIKESMMIRSDSKDSQGFPYTYNWRVGENGDFFAKGILGEFIFISPTKNMVIVRIGKKASDLVWPDFLKALTSQL